MTSIEERHRVLCRVVRDAGERALRFWKDRGALTIEYKGPQDFVTRADKEVEDFIRHELAIAFPDDGFLGEETISTFVEESDRLWIVDPIDGTHNFLRGITYWNVSIAYVEDGVRTLGAVYDPPHAELFHARRGGGAWRSTPTGEMRLQVTQPSTLQGSMVAIGHSDRYPDPRYVALRRALMESGGQFRNFGAGALQLAHVADGRLDAYVELQISAWDAMAGLLLVEEAGGYVGPFPGPQGITAPATAIASAPGIASALLSLLDEIAGE